MIGQTFSQNDLRCQIIIINSAVLCTYWYVSTIHTIRLPLVITPSHSIPADVF